MFKVAKQTATEPKAPYNPRKLDKVDKPQCSPVDKFKLRNRNADGSLRGGHATAQMVAHGPRELVDRVVPLLPYRCDVAILSPSHKTSWTEAVQHAVKQEYLCLNSRTHINAVVIDVDHNDLERWQDCNLPRPTWITVTKGSGRHHIVWLLRDPIQCGPKARQAPLDYLKRVRDALNYELDGDIAYAAKYTKNPFHDRWKCLNLGGDSVSLSELLQPISCAPAPIKTFKRQRRELSNIGRHIDLFDMLRWWSYDQRDSFKTYESFRMAVADEAAALNTFAQPLKQSSVRAIARSVAKWTWYRYDPNHYSKAGTAPGRKKAVRRGAMRLRGVDATLTEKRQMAAKRSSTLNRRATDVTIEQAVKSLMAAGDNVTQASVAKTSGLGLATIKRRWKAVREMVSNGGIKMILLEAGGRASPEPCLADSREGKADSELVSQYGKASRKALAVNRDCSWEANRGAWTAGVVMDTQCSGMALKMPFMAHQNVLQESIGDMDIQSIQNARCSPEYLSDSASH